MLHQHPQIYEEDLVEMTTRSGKKRVGLVSTVSWEEDYLTDDEESYESDDEEDDEVEGEEGEEGEGEGEDGEDKGDGSTDSEGDETEEEDASTKPADASDGTKNQSSGEKEMVCVAFYPSMEEEDVEASRLVVKDRALLFDGIVARAENPLGQTGVVVDVNINASILFPNGEILEGVSTKAIKNIHPYMQDVHVVKDGWLGRIVSCNVDVWIEFEDGSICKVADAKPGKLPLPKEESPTVETHYFPSLILSVPPKTLKTAVWKNSAAIKRSALKKPKKGVIIQAIPTYVEIDWMCSNMDSSVGPPPPMCPAKTLTILDVHVAAQWALGDYAVCPADIRKSQAPQTQLTSQKLAKLQARANSLNVGIVMDTQTYVSVRWQDGTMAQGMRAIDLVPVQHVLHADFWPEDFVIDKEGPQDRVGVVKRVIAEARTCDVMWLPKEREGGQEEKGESTNEGKAERAENENEGKEEGKGKENKEEELETEEVSMYAIESHPDFSYRLGCLVLRLNKDPITPEPSPGPPGEVDNTPKPTTAIQGNDAKEHNDDLSENDEMEDDNDETENNNDDNDNDNDNKNGNNTEENDNNENNNNNASENNNHNDTVQETNKSVGAWVGQIINIHNGILTVYWADGSVSAARPEELFKINDEDYESESEDDEEEYDEEVPEGGEQGENEADRQPTILEQAASIFDTISRARWWMSTDDVGSMVGNFANLLGINNNGEPQNAPQDQTTHTTHANTPNSPITTTNIPAPTIPSPRTHSSPETSFSSTSTSSASSTPTPTPSTPTFTSSCSPASPSTKSTTSNETPLGPKFAVLSDSSGNHYGGSDKISVSTSLLKRVHQEWELLRTTLPDGIYVRTFEDRMDLMTVLFIGPAGTPYEEAVFLFDIHLPPTYPNMPPEMFYYCAGEQLNPNLYKNGNVCLSLLGTWSGRAVEMWQPQTSNILQLLVSVQGLILGTPHPYFLEAGYDKQRGTQVGMHNSRIYNETVYLITIQSIISNARNLPSPFEEVVKQHFKAKGDKILEKCRARASNNNNNNTNNINNNNNNNTNTNNNNTNTISNNTDNTNNNNNTNNIETNATNSSSNTSTPLDETIVFLENPSLGFKKSLGLLIPKLETALQPYQNVQ